MKTETALVRSDGAVELNAVTFVYMNLTVVVYPGNTEHNGALGLDKSFEQCTLLIFGMSFHDRGEGFENLCGCLVKFLFAGVFGFELFKNSLRI